MKPRGILDKEPRTVIPRWRPFELALKRDAQLRSFSRGARIDLDTEPADAEYTKSITDFRNWRNVWFAGDLLTDALARGDDSVAHEVATFILQNPKDASPTLVHMAKAFEGQSEDLESDAQTAVPRLRRQIAVYPASAIAWADLAYYFTMAGKDRAADRAIRTALSLAPFNRFVLRSAARLYVHQEQCDRAHDLLRQCEATPHDPWLIAAEIATATAAERRSRLLKEGRSMVKNFSYDPVHVSELASAIGTAEMEAEAPRRQIRTMFEASLERPTENSVAQAEWAFRRDGIPEAPNLNAVAGANEARAWSAFSGGDYDKALEYASRWFDDQPFSARPAQLISWIDSSLRDDHRTAIDVLKVAVIPNHSDPGILNNLAFAHANLNEIEPARRYNDRGWAAADDEEDQLFAMATRGLIAFRDHRPDEGRKLYMSVIERATGKVDIDDRIVPTAWVHLAREECLAKTPNAFNAVLGAAAAVSECKSLDVKMLFKHIAPCFAEVASELAHT